MILASCYVSGVCLGVFAARVLAGDEIVQVSVEGLWTCVFGWKQCQAARTVSYRVGVVLVCHNASIVLACCNASCAALTGAHRVKRYICPVTVCAKAFTRRSSLRAHLLSGHGYGPRDPTVVGALRRRSHLCKRDELAKALADAQGSWFVPFARLWFRLAWWCVSVLPVAAYSVADEEWKQHLLTGKVPKPPIRDPAATDSDEHDEREECAQSVSSQDQVESAGGASAPEKEAVARAAPKSAIIAPSEHDDAPATEEESKEKVAEAQCAAPAPPVDGASAGPTAIVPTASEVATGPVAVQRMKV